MAGCGWNSRPRRSSLSGRQSSRRHKRQWDDCGVDPNRRHEVLTTTLLSSWAPRSRPQADTSQTRRPSAGGRAACRATPAPISPPTVIPSTQKMETVHDNTTDIYIPGRGIPLSFTRTYNSLLAYQQANGTVSAVGALGYGWTDNLGANLAVSGSTAVFTAENGAQTDFTLSGATWNPGPRDVATLRGDRKWVDARPSRPPDPHLQLFRPARPR